MNRLAPTLVVVASQLFAVTAHADAVGEVHLFAGEMRADSVFWVSDAGVRVESVAQGGQGGPSEAAMLMQSSDKTTVKRFDDKKKVYAALTVREPKEPPDLKVTDLGSEKVNGLLARHVLFVDSLGNEKEVWTNRELFPETLVGMLNIIATGGRELIPKLRALNADGFVVRLVERDEGVVVPRRFMEVVKIENKHVDPSLFVLPADYKKLETAKGPMSPAEKAEAIKKITDNPNLTAAQRDQMLKSMTQLMSGATDAAGNPAKLPAGHP